MIWVVQNNLYNEQGYARFIEALDRLGLDRVIVKPIPFTNRFVPEDFDSMTQEVDDVEEPYIDDSGKVVVCGATTLNRISKERKWNPGTYLNDNFEFEIWRDGFGSEYILNVDSIVCRVKDGWVLYWNTTIIDNCESVFIRPTDDSKAFAGTVMTEDEFDKWRKNISSIEEVEFQPLHQNTQISISSFKKINAEYRMFVVDGKVITGSLYKRGITVISDSNVDQNIIDFAQSMVDKWQPAKAFVIDIADTDKGLKVIEINNINSAGFYECDVQKIIMALEEMENE